ncbi:hypothetical protein, partial [Chitinophaga sp.]|uniref:hypothetical protein n=1 Tax=Chitinophaga sp. TaxID=1869181 RepID=UPI002CD28511
LKAPLILSPSLEKTPAQHQRISEKINSKNICMPINEYNAGPGKKNLLGTIILLNRIAVGVLLCCLILLLLKLL